MCGITGAVAFTDTGRQHLEGISRATYSLLKRGPDSEGLYFNDNVAFGHRRLKIIDTSSAADQPMTDPTGRFTIVFNGEVFNYKELRKDLERKGVKFHTESDTEVLLQQYIHLKEKCPETLNGEFAFAVHDKKTGEVFLARDRYGIKPLYYYTDKDKFLFASEMKALLAFGIPREIDTASLYTYLQLNYIPSPHSIFEKVKKLPAGCFATIRNSEFRIQNYYELPVCETTSALSYEQAVKQLQESLEHSVQQRLVSDVPLGCFLSGGVDSSIISAIAAKHTRHLKTFSIGYKDEKYFDETHYARLVAKKLKTEHTVFSLSNNDLYANLYQVLDYLDEPFADSSALAVHILSMHTRRHVKVALSGDGADELFGGYNKHAAELKARKGGVTTALLRGSAPLLKVLPKSRNTKLGNKVRQLNKFSSAAGKNAQERYWRWAGYAAEEQVGKLLKVQPGRHYSERKDQLLKHLNNDMNSVLYTDICLVLENDMLVKTDRMSMANSLEVRVPFLDHRIVDLALSMPSSYKIDGKRRKKVLRDAFGRQLPEEVFSRKKQGFEVPLLKWLRTDLRPMIERDLLEPGFVREQGIFNSTETEKLKKQLFSSSPDDAVARIWGLIVFQYWYKKQCQGY